MSTESSSTPTDNSQSLSDGSQPLSDGSQSLFLGGSKMPPLPPGYHFILSLCDVACTREQIDSIHEDLVEVARTLIREYELRTASGRFANTRVHINRTVPLIDEDLSDQEREVRTENLQGPVDEAGSVEAVGNGAGGNDAKGLIDSGTGSESATQQ